ncbi:hypothetical protein Bbelb_292160 [Branchiostoma belcheri]|nr:hypothetical protein Bbelb_292160 [Branchiostoma belcheri]
MHVIDPMHNLLEGPAKRVMQTFETPGQSRVRRDRGLAETDKGALATVTRKRVAIFETSDDGKELMRRCRVEDKLPGLVFRMPGGHQVVLTTAENGLPFFTVTLHTENNWKFCGPAELLNVLQPIQNQPEAAMASWQLGHPTPTEGDSGVWTIAMRKVLKNILHYVGEEPETYAASVLSVQRPVSATGPVTTPRRRLAPTGQASTSTAPTASDNTGTTDPTPAETTGYSDGETESLDDSTPDFSLLADVRLSLSPTDPEPTNPPSTSTPTPSSPSALLPVPKKRRLAASPRKPAPG